MGNERKYRTQIPLRDRKGNVRAYAVVDDLDADRVAQHKWHLNSGGYVVHQTPKGPDGRQQTISLARFIMGCEPGDGKKVDHIDHDLLNNTRTNLRICTHRENHENRLSHRGSSSRYRGVSWNKQARKWRAYGMKDGQQVYLGDHDDEDEAGRVAAEWRKAHMPFSVES